MKFVIDLKFPSLNEYVNMERKNRYYASSFKKKMQQNISVFIDKTNKVTKPSVIKFIWHEGNSRRDKDNVAFGKKFILDALQECGVLENDNNKWVLGFQDDFVYDGTWKCEVIID